MLKKIVISSAFLLGAFAFTVRPAFAFSIPNFPQCETPQGAVISSSTSGSHGIVGDMADHQGTDTVFSIAGNSQVMQCFCPNGGQGIQTNWLDAAGLSSDSLDLLRREGWIFVPNGALWGLNSDPYMAINSSFTCGVGGGSILGASTGEVLGMASTGFAKDDLLKALGITLLCIGFVTLITAHVRAKRSLRS